MLTAHVMLRVPATRWMNPLILWIGFLVVPAVATAAVFEELAAGDSVRQSTSGDEVHWFRVPAVPGSPMVVDLATEHDLVAYIRSAEGATLGQANRSHAFEVSAAEATDLVIAVERNGPQPGPWRLSVYARELPFHVALPPADWPSQLLESAHRYPNTDFGYVFVRESRAQPTANVLRIAVARMASSNPSARPLLFLNGGPGDSGIRSGYQYYLQGFLGSHHVYLIDQRGVNLSQPVLEVKDDESIDDFQYRLRQLEGVDLGAIHTAESAQDIDDIVRALELPSADILSQSYGTFLAQVILRGNPPWLRAVILDGVMPLSIPTMSQTGPVRHAALQALFRDLADHPLYRDFAQMLYGLAERLQAQPAVVPVGAERVTLDGLGLLDALLNQLTSTDLGYFERLPAIIWRAYHGETRALAELFQFRKDTDVVFNTAHNMVQQILVVRHDVLPFDSLEWAYMASSHMHPLLAELSIGFMQEAIWAAGLFEDYGQAPAGFTQPVTTAIPTLVINGEYDMQTSPDWAANVAAHLPLSHFVRVPATGHGVLFATNGCTLRIMRDFLANPLQRPATDCLDALVPEFPEPWPATLPKLVAGTVLNYPRVAPLGAQWFVLETSPPAEPVGGVADLLYEVDLSGLAADAHAAVFDATSGQLLASIAGPGRLGPLTSGSPLRLGVFSGDYEVSPGFDAVGFHLPVLIRRFSFAGPDLTVVWQGPSGSLMHLEATSGSGLPNGFAPISEPIHAESPLLQFTVPDALAGAPSRFFRAVARLPESINEGKGK